MSEATDTKATAPPALTAQDLAELRPVLARNARVAKALFRAAYGNVLIEDGGRTWRADETGPTALEADPASGLVTASGQALWISDLSRDERFSRHRIVRATRGMRHYAGAPIKVGDRVLGVLAVYGPQVLDYDRELADRLQDLADAVATEYRLFQGRRKHEALLDEMKQTQERLNFAVESTGLYVYDIDYVKEEVKRTGVEQSFYVNSRGFEDMRDRLQEVVHPDDMPAVIESWRRHREEGIPQRAEWRLNRTDKLIWAESTAENFYDETGKLVRRIGTIRNITERKLAEAEMVQAKAAAEAANIAKSAFLATMSHEIRTPLNGVLGMAQAMAADDLSDIQRDRLEVVRQSGEALLAILNDLLDLSKIEAGKMEIEEIEFDLAEIALGAYATFTALANKKGLSFALDIDTARGAYRGDPTRIRQVLYNLISNALKFTEQGEIRVQARYEGNALVMSVSDTGVGMAPDVQASLFTKFTQADTSTTRKFGGTGLGLAICKQLAELMNGAVEVKSAEGKGTTFTFKVPLVRTGAGKTTGEVETPTLTPLADSAAQSLEIRVLAAEDNAVNQLVLKTLLHQIGVDPVVVENGALAVEAWETGEWDVILMDVQMPVMDGPSATRAIRAREAATGRTRTPIVALTANAMSHQIAEYRACGMDGHVTKPIEALKLFAALEAALDQVDAARAAA